MGVFIGTVTAVTVLAEGEVTQSWNFSNPGDYVISDSNSLEVASNSAKLKIQNYSSDSDTQALYHLDANSGTTVSDSSANNNAGSAGADSWSSGRLNNAYDFDGINKTISVPDSESLSLSQANTLEAWVKLDNAFSPSVASQHQGIIDKGSYRLYFDRTTGKINYELADSSATTWTQVAGNDLNGSWDLNGNLAINSTVEVGGDIYVGLGNAIADAEVWKWDGTSWAKVGGDGVNSGWADQTFESVLALATDGDKLYAGLGITAGDGEVWMCDTSDGCADWTRIGGDGVSSSWTAVGAFEGVYSLVYMGSTLYAGLGASANDAEVWAWNGSTWNRIGGDSINSGWTTNFEYVFSLVGDGTNLYAGLGNTAGDAEVWRWNGTAWSRIGGDTVNSSWNATDYEVVTALYYMGSNLYAGLGTTANDAEVWRWNGTSWTQIGGDSMNSGWLAGFEAVYSLTGDGTNLYAGLGNTAGDNEVWIWNGSAWNRIGGDGINSGFANTHTIVNSLLYADSVLYAGLLSTGASAEMWTWNGSSWTLIGGNYIKDSWGFFNLQSVEVLDSHNGKLYAATGFNQAGNAMVFEFNGTTWSLIGGQGKNSSWHAKSHEIVNAMESFKGDLYVGLGSTANDAEVWKYNGSTWSQIGGDSMNSGWLTGFETVQSMATYNGDLYVGLGLSANDAEVWRWNGSAWNRIGGDSTNSGWTTNFEAVYSLVSHNNYLYAGVGNTAGDAEVWRWNGTVWNRIGGDGVNSSWNTVYEQVDILTIYNNELYAGVGTGTGEAYVYKWNGSVWSLVGGDEVNNSWIAGTYERVRAFASYNGKLYAGLGTTAGESEVWAYDGSAWAQVGGDTMNDSWPNNASESVHSLRAHKGKLYAGLGESANVDASVWAYGDNGFLQSTTTNFNTDWHHIAATYDGSSMKLYINGVLDSSTNVTLSMPNNSANLLIGTTYGSTSNGSSQGLLAGLMDEVRISKIARSSFNSTPYNPNPITIHNASAVFTQDISEFLSFTAQEIPNGGTIKYRFSTDSGTTWKFWNGSSWATSNSLAQANTETEVNDNIQDLAITSSGIKWQAILDGDGSGQVTLSSVEIEAQSDVDDPSSPGELTALDVSSGSVDLDTDTWYTYPTPYFSWEPASDDGAGVAGYFVYFGTDPDAVPSSTQGTFQTQSYFSASGLSSGATYYLRIQTKDNAQNTSPLQTQFIYKYDSSPPTNPGTVTVTPSGYASTNAFTFSWPTAGDNIATDVGSQVAGYQYKTGASTGPLSTWSTTTTSNSITINDAAYQTNANTFYLRTIDNAGNFSATPLQATYYFAGEGPSKPRFLSATPSSNTVNSFAFSWDPPETFSGSEDDLTYCYTINTLPAESTCTYTSPGATSVSASAFATQVGLNTFYLVAKSGEDVGGAINYGAYESVTFTANTAAPGIPLNLEISDVSIKSTESWRLALSWTAPEDEGSGVDSYKIYRSLTGESFTELSTTTGTAHIDTNLEQKEYFYKVRACDSVENCGAYTSAVSLLPTGKFTEAAALKSEPKVTSITTKKATVTWSTDRASDSKIQYGTKSGDYFDEEPSNSSQVTAHEIALVNLKPGTTYYAVAKWTDEDGNTGTSDEFKFSTTPAPIVKDPSVKSFGLNGITLEFTVKGASRVKVYYGKTTAFGGSVELSTSPVETTYNAAIDELEDGVKYYYKINTFDDEGEEYEGSTLSFETLPRPRITNVRIQQVKGSAQPAALISWNSNTEISSIITFYPEGNPQAARDEVNVELVKGLHRLLIKALQPETKYVLIVKGRDKAGNEATSDIQNLTTATDTRAPLISNLRVEGAITKPGSDNFTAQLVVSWDTDEPATSQVEYGEGTGGAYSQKTQQDANFTTNHVVIITGLSTSKVYHLRALSKDKAGNEISSIDTVTITPKASSNALDLVITNLSEVFGFLGNSQ
jgi:hypothetical protein